MKFDGARSVTRTFTRDSRSHRVCYRNGAGGASAVDGVSDVVSRLAVARVDELGVALLRPDMPTY
jgi:hypothetical protein